MNRICEVIAHVGRRCWEYMVRKEVMEGEVGIGVAC